MSTTRDGLAVVGLVERVLEQRAGVAHALADALGAVQVAERDVVEAVEQVARDLAGAADRERPLGLATSRAGDEGVGDDHVPGVVVHLLAHEVQLRLQHGLVRVDVLAPERAARGLGIGVGERPEDDLHAVGAGDATPARRRADLAHDVQAHARDQTAEVLQAPGAVVVAGDHHHRDPQVEGQRCQHVVQDAHGLGGRRPRGRTRRRPRPRRPAGPPPPGAGGRAA